MFEKKEVKVIDETKVKKLQQEILELKNEIKNNNLFHESEVKILNSELKTKITEAIREKEVENNELKEKNAVLTKEIEILTKAFENMGFDVKDMKDILNKLVDGIVSKNEINVIK